MILLVILIFIISILEIRCMVKKRQKRDMVLFIIISVLSVSLGCYYFSNPYRESFIQHILSVFGQKY
jgi:uncharacterized membrane protein HdeD (DUF308 family)